MRRVVWLVLAGLCVFAIVAFVMIQFMPQPVKPFDYMIAGSVATIAALLVVFLGVATRDKSSNIFFKRRKK